MRGEGGNTETGVVRGVRMFPSVHPMFIRQVIPLAQHFPVSLDFRHCVIAWGKISTFNPPLPSSTRCSLGPSLRRQLRTGHSQRFWDVSDLALSLIHQANI